MSCQARQLERLLNSSARHCSTARQLDSYSTDLDRPRQTSTDLDSGQNSTPRRTESGSTGSTGTRQELDRLDRQGLDSGSTVHLNGASTARQPGWLLNKSPKLRSQLSCSGARPANLKTSTRASTRTQHAAPAGHYCRPSITILQHLKLQRTKAYAHVHSLAIGTR